MKVIDILNSEECKPLFEEVQKFVQISLSEYNKAIEKSGFSYTDKDIFDFVWGTVEFSAAEICILDSPLLQRLRRIKQLGLASTVYCNADNSRFSHTIGVTEVASRMARMVTRRLDNSAYGPEEFDAEEIVRIAAIFHDTGHMFFSHVSELYFAYDKSFPRYKEITRALTHFSTAASAEVALHELISVMIVNSPETMKLFQLISPYMKKSRLTKRKHFEQLAEYISCLIIGIPNNKFILPYSGIINSAIDADKLDYLSRDSACTKVPIAVDIARIVQKLDVVNIKEIEYPAIWNDQTSEAWPLKIMAIKNSAKSVFWQLSNARSSMYESVYYHHKVLTAETMEAGRRSKQEQFYLLTNCKDRDTVFLAFEKALAKYMMLQLPKEASICSKVSYEMINEKRHRLLEKGYYKDVLYILKDDIFMSLLDKRQFKAILEKYGSFSGVSNCKITEKSLREYLRQFLYLQIETNEHHVDELTDAEKERLKSIRVVLTYLCFNSKSEKYVKEEFAEIGLTNIDICYIKDLSQKVFDNIPPYFSSKNQCDITQKHLKQIGEDVLMSTKKLPAGDFKSRWSKERIEEGALGYNDAQQCVVFSTNIPTYSLTALWANGEFAGNEWRGLFQRTVKD